MKLCKESRKRNGENIKKNDDGVEETTGAFIC